MRHLQNFKQYNSLIYCFFLALQLAIVSLDAYIRNKIVKCILGCMDDGGTQYSFGQQFVTTDCCQCFCGNGGSISCDQTQNNSSKLTIKNVIMRKNVF